MLKSTRLRSEALEPRLPLALTPVGPPTSVQPTEGTYSFDVDVAADAEGNFTVVWEERVGPSNELQISNVVARRYDRLGRPLGPSFQVNALDNNPGEPRIDMAPDGMFVIAWESHDVPGGPTAEVFARRYAADGQPLDAEEIFVSTDEGFGSNVAVAVNPSHAFALSWVASGIHAKSFDATGEPVGEAFAASRSSLVHFDRFTTIDIADDGAIVVGWRHEIFVPPDLPVGRMGRFRLFAASGEPLTEEINVDLTTNTSKAAPAFLGETPADGVVVAYREFRDDPVLLLRRYVGQDLDPQPLTEVAQFERGDFLIDVVGESIIAAWDAGEPSHFFRSFNLAGEPTTDILPMQPAGRKGNSLAVSPFGIGQSGEQEVVFAWVESLRFVPEIIKDVVFQRFSLSPLAGDVNGDEVVDLEDFNLLKANFGTGANRWEGDLTGDGAVDLHDFAQLKANFGDPQPDPQAALAAALAGIHDEDDAV